MKRYEIKEALKNFNRGSSSKDDVELLVVGAEASAQEDRDPEREGGRGQSPQVDVPGSKTGRKKRCGHSGQLAKKKKN